jgi:hypothetical protein
MDEEQLPPLPEPDGAGIDCDTDDGSYWYAPAMREYARAAVLAERERCAKVCEQIAHEALRDQPALQVLIRSSHGYRFAAAIRGHAEEKQ